MSGPKLKPKPCIPSVSAALGRWPLIPQPQSTLLFSPIPPSPLTSSSKRTLETVIDSLVSCHLAWAVDGILMTLLINYFIICLTLRIVMIVKPISHFQHVLNIWEMLPLFFFFQMKFVFFFPSCSWSSITDLASLLLLTCAQAFYCFHSVYVLVLKKSKAAMFVNKLHLVCGSSLAFMSF